jgi:probable rRNA maturation factor
MSRARPRVPVKLEFQDATGDTKLPAPAEWNRWVSAAMGATLEESGAAAPRSITVRLVGREESGQLNATYRKRTGPTNVLAFPGPSVDTPLPDADCPGIDQEELDRERLDQELGDLVICMPVVYAEAQEQGKSPAAHMAHMVIHGTLHLLGFDHETGDAAMRMERIETRIMLDLGFADPYEQD